jgi:hypothetical protein
MGIVHIFVRATEEELTRAIADPTSFEGTSGRPPEEMADLDKALPDIQELLVAADIKVDLELGGEMIFPYGNDTDFVMVWSVDDVADTAEQLRDVPFDRLATFVDDPDLVDDPEELDYLKEYYEDVVGFFVAAAEARAGAFMITT